MIDLASPTMAATGFSPAEVAVLAMFAWLYLVAPLVLVLAGLVLVAFRSGAQRRPPEVPGSLDLHTADRLRTCWWTTRGLVYGTRNGTRGERTLSMLLLLGAILVAPTWCAALWIATLRPWARYYLGPGRRSALAVSGTVEGWNIDGYVCDRPGHKRAVELRELLIPPLIAHVDAEQIVVRTTAANRRLAEMYADVVPGLVVVGRSRWRGWRMQRNPSRPTDENC